MNGDPRLDELLELLATKSTEGLSPAERLRLDELLADYGLGEGYGEDYYDLAAAAADLAVDAPIEALPDELAARLVGLADEVLSTPSTTSRATAPPPARERVVSFRRDELPSGPPAATQGFDWLRWGGWIAAAAIAGFSLGLGFLTPRPAETPDPAPIVEPTPQTAAERREALIANATDLRRIEWVPTEHALGAGVVGEVVWSDELQEGYMTFRGLAWNDPTQRQYQLWVFDAERSEERPVDGGVFDIPAVDSEVVIPIDTKLGVSEATLFVITLEQPGGVVVSSREDLLLIAPVA